MGGDNLLVRLLFGGWSVSGIYQAASGIPIAVTSTSCTSTPPNSGQCMPSVTPGSTGARTNGGYGGGLSGKIFSNLNTVKYVDPNAFGLPADLSTVPAAAHQYKFGNAPRTLAYGIRTPGVNNVNASLKRNFRLWEGAALAVEADVSNLFNRVQFNGPNVAWSTTATAASNSFGTINGITNQPRSWQFAGHFIF
jgi:hypothetical protein